MESEQEERCNICGKEFNKCILLEHKIKCQEEKQKQKSPFKNEEK